jgi:DNA polymerase
MEDRHGLIAALKLQLEWGADEALAELPLDRRTALAVPPVAAPPPAPVPRPETPAPAPAPAQAAALAARADTPAALRAALEAFDGCALRASATHLVFADGNPTAGLVFIGEAPGTEEDRTGRAFSGAGGQLLDRMLASIGLDRGHCLLTYVIPWRPPGNRPPGDLEVASCLPFLHRHLALLRPRRLVLLGALPARLLTGRRQPLGRLRGRWTDAPVPGLEYTPQALPMQHPDHLLAQPAARRDAWADLLLLRRTLDEETAQVCDTRGDV